MKIYIFALKLDPTMCNKSNIYKYAIITPAKNEENYIENTLHSICTQTIKPTEWIIVNDGSTDRTKEIVENYAQKYPWIRLINNDTYHEKRAGGSKVVRAFYEGYNSIENHDYDFIVKLDADLTLPKNYFEEVSKCFENNLKVGLCGGYCVVEKNGKLVKEKSAGYHLRGPIKSYRKECFEDIGGLKPVLNWDGLDEMTTMFKGWTIKILPLQVFHHRPTSTTINRGLFSSFRSGKEYYCNSYDFFLAILRSITFGKRTMPYMISGIIFLFGFITAFCLREKKHVDKKLEKYIRSFQYNRIFKFVHFK